VAIRQAYHPGGDAQKEPKGVEQGDAGFGQRKNEDGAAGEKNYSRYKETRKRWTNGNLQLMFDCIFNLTFI